MKKYVALFLAMTMMFALCACGSAVNNKTPEKLIESYLTAVKDRDYEAIWNMLPKEIQDYAIREDYINNKDEGVNYIRRAIKEDLVFASLDLPSCKTFSFRIVERYPGDEYSQEYCDEEGVRLTIDGDEFIKAVITADGKEQEAWFWVIKVKNAWYLTSATGNDTIFEA